MRLLNEIRHLLEAHVINVKVASNHIHLFS